MKPTKDNVVFFLKESNAIEGEYDDKSLLDSEIAWGYIMALDELSTTDIKYIHSLVMVSRDIEDKYKGDWRDVPVRIGNEIKSQPKIVIDSLMRDFCDEINTFPEDILLMHLKFEGIHPFIDGNGRMGRLIMNWQSVKQNNELLVFTEKNKYDVYYPIFTRKQKNLQRALKLAKEGKA